jgi:cell division protein FtsB
MRKRNVNFIITKKQLLHGILTSVLLYFIFHAIYGNRGILAYYSLSHQIEEAEKELDVVKAETMEIDHKVNSMRPESLDPDMLDEQARKNLGVASSTEKAFLPHNDNEE